MNYITSIEKPNLIDTKYILGQPEYTINAFIEEVIQEDEKIIYKYVPITLPVNTWNKNVIISGLIKANYPADRMDAIRNNYELVRDGTAGDKEEEYTQEYIAMQDWRVYSKELAKEIIDSKENDV